MAAVESLIAFLAATPSSTAMETVEMVQTQAEMLLKAFPNPKPLQAGTDRQFVAEAKKARDTIAHQGAKLVHDGEVVMATGGSRAVTNLLLHRRTTSPEARFTVLYVVDGHADSEEAATTLAKVEGIDVRRVPLDGIANALAWGNVSLVLVGAEVLCGNGGLLARRGTYQLASLAKAHGKKFVAAAETHKIVRGYPLNSLERFGVTDEGVDYTPPDHIKWIVTEDGLKQPSDIFDYILNVYM
jgi:translation initiation factor eIF-2B subunit alpha